MTLKPTLQLASTPVDLLAYDWHISSSIIKYLSKKDLYNCCLINSPIRVSIQEHLWHEPKRIDQMNLLMKFFDTTIEDSRLSGYVRKLDLDSIIELAKPLMQPEFRGDSSTPYFTDLFVDAVMALLVKCYNLAELSVPWNLLNTDLFKLLLNLSKQLKVLKIKGQSMNTNIIELFVTRLGSESLVELEINTYGLVSYNLFKSLLPRLKNLKSLVLVNAEISIEELSLSFNGSSNLALKLTDSQLTAQNRKFKSNTKVTKLSLINCTITQNTFNLILVHFTLLEVLKLKVTDTARLGEHASTINLKPSQIQCIFLKQLSVCGYELLNNESLAMFGLFCPQLEKIEVFGSSCIDDNSIIFLKNLPKLTQISYTSCRLISSLAVDYLCKFFSKSIKRIYLIDCSVNYSDFPSDVFSEFKSLQSLKIETSKWIKHTTKINFNSSINAFKTSIRSNDTILHSGNELPFQLTSSILQHDIPMKASSVQKDPLSQKYSIGQLYTKKSTPLEHRGQFSIDFLEKHFNKETNSVTDASETNIKKSIKTSLIDDFSYGDDQNLKIDNSQKTIKESALLLDFSNGAVEIPSKTKSTISSKLIDAEEIKLTDITTDFKNATSDRDVKICEDMLLQEPCNRNCETDDLEKADSYPSNRDSFQKNKALLCAAGDQHTKSKKSHILKDSSQIITNINKNEDTPTTEPVRAKHAKNKWSSKWTPEYLNNVFDTHLVLNKEASASSLNKSFPSTLENDVNIFVDPHKINHNHNDSHWRHTKSFHSPQEGGGAWDSMENEKEKESFDPNTIISKTIWKDLSSWTSFVGKEDLVVTDLNIHNNSWSATDSKKISIENNQW